jgi:hypothetical protein
LFYAMVERIAPYGSAPHSEMFVKKFGANAIQMHFIMRR